MRISQWGSSPAGMNTPEMKHSGNTTACSTGWAASVFTMKVAIANPRAQNAAVPTTRSRRSTPAAPAGIDAPKAAQPIAASTPTTASPAAAAASARAPISEPAETGVARRRL